MAKTFYTLQPSQNEKIEVKQNLTGENVCLDDKDAIGDNTDTIEKSVHIHMSNKKNLKGRKNKL
jgi:hypothetical protein